MKIPRRTKIVIAVILWAPFCLLFGWILLFEPSKFAWLIRQVESARTAEEERDAFELAKRWGYVFEIHLESPPKTWLDPRQLDAVVQDPRKQLAVEIEWLEAKPTGTPYRAYRTLTEKTNLFILQQHR